MATYFDRLSEAMVLLSKHPRAILMGQCVEAGGTPMADTFADVPREKLLEVPVVEDMQAGMAIGMALGGYLPVCVYLRWNFAILAANQLVNHLDRIPLYSAGAYFPKVIIRVAVPSTKPFAAGWQHDDDFTEAFAQMFHTIDVVKLLDEASIVPAYQRALDSKRSTMLVEYVQLYKETSMAKDNPVPEDSFSGPLPRK